MNITIFGKGNMSQAIQGNFEASGSKINVVTRENDAALGDIVVLAVPYPAVDDIIARYGEQLAGKIVIDITNPLNFETFDELIVPADCSAAQEIQAKLPNSTLFKGFNTNFASTLATGKVADAAQTTVLLASDSADAKAKIAEALTGSSLNIVDAGALKRARELESIGFLQLTLAAGETINWNGGFSLHK